LPKGVSVAGDVGPLFCLRELTLAGGAVMRLSRETALLVSVFVLVLVLVMGTLTTISPSSNSSSFNLATQSSARLAESTSAPSVVGPLFCLRELTLAGGGMLWLLRETALLVLVLVLVVRELATLIPSS